MYQSFLLWLVLFMSCLKKASFKSWYHKDILLFHLLKALLFCFSDLVSVHQVECVCVWCEVWIYSNFLPYGGKKSSWHLGSVFRHTFYPFFCPNHTHLLLQFYNKPWYLARQFSYSILLQKCLGLLSSVYT